MLFAQRLLGVVLITALGGCSTIRVASDTDPSAKFTGYKTYNWVAEAPKKTGDPRIDGNSILASRIRSSVVHQLAAKGYEKRSSGTPDFLVGYHASLEKKTSVRMLMITTDMGRVRVGVIGVLRLTFTTMTKAH